MKMAPEDKHFLLYGILKPVYQCHCHDHYRHAERSGQGGEPDDKTGKRCFPVPGYALGYEVRKMQ